MHVFVMDRHTQPDTHRSSKALPGGTPLVWLRSHPFSQGLSLCSTVLSALIRYQSQWGAPVGLVILLIEHWWVRLTGRSVLWRKHLSHSWSGVCLWTPTQQLSLPTAVWPCCGYEGMWPDFLWHRNQAGKNWIWYKAGGSSGLSLEEWSSYLPVKYDYGKAVPTPNLIMPLSVIILEPKYMKSKEIYSPNEIILSLNSSDYINKW